MWNIIITKYNIIINQFVVCVLISRHFFYMSICIFSFLVSLFSFRCQFVVCVLISRLFFYMSICIFSFLASLFQFTCQFVVCVLISRLFLHVNLYFFLSCFIVPIYVPICSLRFDLPSFFCMSICIFSFLVSLFPFTCHFVVCVLISRLFLHVNLYLFLSSFIVLIYVPICSLRFDLPFFYMSICTFLFSCFIVPI